MAGDGILVRLRSTTIGLLGLVTVVSLGLVAFVSQIGWPGVLSGPLPDTPAPGVVQNDTIALAQAETYPLLATRGIAGRRPQTAASRHGETAPSPEPDVAGADQLTEAPAEHTASPDPPPSDPSPQTAPVPVSQPTGQEPSASTPASGAEGDGAEEPVAAGSGGKSRGRDSDKEKGRGKEKGRERDDRPRDSGDRNDDRRGGSDDREDDRSSPLPPEDRWDDDDGDWDDDRDDHWEDRDGGHDQDDKQRGKSDDHRH